MTEMDGIHCNALWILYLSRKTEVAGRVLMKIRPGKEALLMCIPVCECMYERKRDRETQEEYTRHLRGGRP